MMPRRPLPPQSVLMIGSEALPFSKTGGLADVLGALPLALAEVGWSVTVVSPKYRGVDAGALVDQFPVGVGGFTRDVGFHEVSLGERARAVLVDCPDLFDREALYGIGNSDYADNARRFAMLVRAALEFAGRRGRPSIVHAHDWQAGLRPVFSKPMYASPPMLGGAARFLTDQNPAYQGLFEPGWLPRLDLPWSLLTTDRLEYWGRISFLKGGINDANLITTVSPQYGREIQTPELGFGFDGILRRRPSDLVGFLNGIDTDQWNPASDQFLPAPFQADDLSAKALAKREVLRRYSLPVEQTALARPLIGMISRMVDQKGFDLLASVVDELPRLEATWVLLGTGEARYQDLWTGLAARHPDRIGVRIDFSEELAHLIEGGADIFLMPSRFEPCGFNQMYSLRYGTVPVVHYVGGLVDTVRDFTLKGATSTGFVFREYTREALLAALQRALAAFQDTPRWRALQVAGMRRDNSWDHSAREYVKIYRRALRQTDENKG